MADSSRYHADAGRLWEADDDPEEATLLTTNTLEYDPGAGMLRHTFTNVNDETLTVEVPVIASANWNEFVSSLPLWTERNDVTGEVDNDDNGSDDGDNAPRRVQYQEAKDQLMEKGFLTGGDAQRAIKALEKINAISVK